MGSESTEQNIMGIDLRVMLSDYLRGAKHLLWLGILLILLASAAFSWWTYVSYAPR